MDIISIRGFSVYHEGTAIQCYLVPHPCSSLEAKVIIYFLIGKIYSILLLVCFERQGHCRSDLSLATVESATQQLFNSLSDPTILGDAWVQSVGRIDKRKERKEISFCCAHKIRPVIRSTVQISTLVYEVVSLQIVRLYLSLVHRQDRTNSTILAYVSGFTVGGTREIVCGEERRTDHPSRTSARYLSSQLLRKENQ